MAKLRKKTTTRPVPAGAMIVETSDGLQAVWTNRKGRKICCPVIVKDGACHVVTKSGTWYARIRLADGRQVDIPTGCRDKGAATARMTEIVSEQEKIRGGILSVSEVRAAKENRRSFAEVVDEYLSSLEACGRADKTVRERRRYLIRAGVTQFGWRSLRDMNRNALEDWLAVESARGKRKTGKDSSMGARVHNCYVAAFMALGNWCVRRGYLAVNPFVGTEKRDERADRRHVRRVFTAQELPVFLEAARTRPLADAMRGNRGRGEEMSKERASLKAATIERLESLGRTRRLAYWTAVTTGLRWGELRSITMGAACLDADPPYLELAAKNEKSRRGAQIPLRSDVASELREYIREKRNHWDMGRRGTAREVATTWDTLPLFDVPAKMTKGFDADLRAAGIPKRNSLGHVLDIHSLRHTFCTMLAMAGVPLQLAQKAMRHSTPVLTANAYTHLGRADIADAVNRTPAVVDTSATRNVAPNVAPTDGVGGQYLALSVIQQCVSGATDTNCVSSLPVNGGRDASVEGNGGRCRARTCDPLRVRQML